MDILVQPSITGAALAALAVAGGAPLFSDGLRTLRLRRQFERLSERPLDEAPTGFIHTRGKVILDSPLFSPLSGKPCAGFRLEVRGGAIRRAAAVEERRPFRIASGETTARVLAGGGRWLLSETERREFGPDDTMSENLCALLRRCPEVAWLQRQRLPMTLTERALFAGAESHIVGYARQSRPYEMPPEMEMARTGTDDVVQPVAGRAAVALATVDIEPAESRPSGAGNGSTGSADGTQPAKRGGGPFGIERRTPGRPFPGEVDLWVDGGGLLDFVLVSDAPPQRRELAMSKWRTLGLLLGPALSMAGLLYLAHAADTLHSQGRF
ncbi:MAG TPA: hypothetical protein VJY35_00700 [Candidatus Eisenbacteria bacterium]|nr:hypothetical protein [Candidatus Eisenbacteria bacterium]